MFFVEIRPAVRRSGPPRMVALDEVSNHSGFRTIVAYDDVVAGIIMKQGGTQNLRGFPVYADTLFLDFDDHDPTEFRDWLKQSGLAYTEWDSGNRSFHYHIPLVPIYATWVTAAMKIWIKEHAPKADISFVHNAGVYRLPGTFHSKNAGRCKVQIASGEGKPLTLERPPIAVMSFDTGDAEGSIEDFFCLLLQHKSEGHRAPHLFKMAITGAEAGLPYEETLSHLRWWNEKMTTIPRDDLTVQKQCESAYRRLSRKQA